MLWQRSLFRVDMDISIIVHDGGDLRDIIGLKRRY
jgi:hypothetical protein